MRSTWDRAPAFWQGADRDPLEQQTMLSPFKELEWVELSPAERLARAWALRKRLTNAVDAHDRKLFPAP